jgi:hypothetical protein
VLGLLRKRNTTIGNREHYQDASLKNAPYVMRLSYCARPSTLAASTKAGKPLADPGLLAKPTRQREPGTTLPARALFVCEGSPASPSFPRKGTLVNKQNGSEELPPGPAITRAGGRACATSEPDNPRRRCDP